MVSDNSLRRLTLALSMIVAMASMVLPLTGWAANNCIASQSGIGGTGAAAHDGGIGGTGSPTLGSGIGGTGSPALESGIGGTGSPALESGIGGTGHTAQDGGIGGTGVVGIITGFASICVNGIEIHYNQKTPMEINGHPGKAKDLAIGQLVMADATGKGDELVARHISVRYAVSGPVTHTNAANGHIQVMGQTVQITGHTIKPDEANAQTLHAGDFVRVSGLRKQDGVIVAARIDRVPAQHEVSVSGPVSHVSGHEFSIYGLHVSGNVPAGLAAGREVHVSGQMQNGLLRADKIDIAPHLPFGGRNQRLELQGYLRASRSAGKVNVGPTQIDISQLTKAGGKLEAGQLVRVSARVTPDKHLVAEHIEVARDYFQHGEPRNINHEGAGHPANKTEGKDSGDTHTGKRPAETGGHGQHARPEGGERSESPGKDKPAEEHSGRAALHERREHTERAEQPDRTERLERTETPERAERVERVEIPERVERVERVETPERVERVERVEIPERVERVERPGGN